MGGHRLRQCHALRPPGRPSGERVADHRPGQDGRLGAVVALPAPLVQALRQHKEAQATERERAGKSWKDHDLVFPTAIGTPMDPRNLNRHFADLCDRAGVRRVRFHDLRHSCATLLDEQGVKIENIQDVLGHSSPTITKTLYVDPTDKVRRGAVDKLAFLFDE
ncbi:tyrosine-type recombinase/integrase [Rugosimonospora acidiphila]